MAQSISMETGTRSFSHRTLAGDLAAAVGGPATIEGWLTTRRDLGSVTFLVLRDRSGSAQVVVEDERLSETLAGLQVESVLAITGDVVAEPRARGGAELRAREIEVLSPVVEPLPPNWKAYLKQPPVDPWGKPYQYLNPGVRGEIDVFSLGADGQPGGEGVAADIGNWSLNR